jgi:hypothetical protein
MMLASNADTAPLSGAALAAPAAWLRAHEPLVARVGRRRIQLWGT